MDIQKAIERDEIILKTLIEKGTRFSEEDRKIAEDGYEKVVMGNMGDAEATIANMEELDLTKSKRVADINKTRAETLLIRENTISSSVKANAEIAKLNAETEQIQARIELERLKTMAEIAKTEAEKELLEQERKHVLTKILAPGIGLLGGIALAGAIEKLGGIIITGAMRGMIGHKP